MRALLCGGLCGAGAPRGARGRRQGRRVDRADNPILAEGVGATEAMAAAHADLHLLDVGFLARARAARMARRRSGRDRSDPAYHLSAVDEKAWKCRSKARRPKSALAGERGVWGLLGTSADNETIFHGELTGHGVSPPQKAAILGRNSLPDVYILGGDQDLKSS